MEFYESKENLPKFIKMLSCFLSMVCKHLTLKLENKNLVRKHKISRLYKRMNQNGSGKKTLENLKNIFCGF